MKERPILMSGPMVRALLNGTKTQTRRAMKPQPDCLYRLTDERLMYYHREHENNDWCLAEADPNFSKRRLHGGSGWEDLLSNEICWLWSKGFRGLVSVTGAQNSQGLYLGFALPQQPENHKDCASPCLYGISRNAAIYEQPDSPLGWEPNPQRTSEFAMGNATGQLGRSEIAQQAVHKPNLQIHVGRAGAYPLDYWQRALQSAEYISDIGRSPILHLSNLPFQVSQSLWLRETFTTDGVNGEAAKQLGRPPVHYRADGEAPAYLGVKWRPSIFMPRKFSRITLEIVAVRVERVQDISNRDALAEGVVLKDHGPHLNHDNACAIEEYARLWDTLNASRAPWASNPFVWVIEFKGGRKQ